MSAAGRGEPGFGVAKEPETSMRAWAVAESPACGCDVCYLVTARSALASTRLKSASESAWAGMLIRKANQV